MDSKEAVDEARGTTLFIAAALGRGSNVVAGYPSLVQECCLFLLWVVVCWLAGKAE